MRAQHFKCLLGLTAIAVGMMAGLGGGVLGADESVNALGRVARFPEDHSLGWLYVRPTDSDDPCDWKHAGPARGEIAVKVGHDLRLVMKGISVLDLSPLAALQADTLDSLDLGQSFSIGGMDGAQLRHLAGLTGLKELGLRDVPISAHQLEPILTLRQLERIDLGNTRVGKEAIPLLLQFPKLRRLRLYNYECPGSEPAPQGLAEGLVEARPHLLIESHGYDACGESRKSLSIKLPDDIVTALDRCDEKSKINGVEIWEAPPEHGGYFTETRLAVDFIPRLASFENLFHLNLNVLVQADGLEKISGLSKLESLSINVEDPESALESLELPHTVEQLALGSSKPFTAKAVRLLARWKNLEFLSFQTPVTDLEPLMAFDWLHTLVLIGEVPPGQWEALRQALPNCDIVGEMCGC